MANPSLVCSEPGRLVLEERPDPEPSGGVLVRMRFAGVCGTDFAILQGRHPFLEYPRVLGHELSAEVLEVPPGSELVPGTPVIVNPYLTCGRCVSCRQGRANCCTTIEVLGVHTDGGMCRVLELPEDVLYPADGLGLEEAAMVEFLAVGAHGVQRGAATSADDVAIVGLGPIGLGAALFARQTGARLTLVDVSEERLESAERVLSQAAGPTSGVRLVRADGGQRTLESLASETGGDLFSLVIDATGSRRAMEQSLHFVRHTGRIVFLSVVNDSVAFPDPLIHAREMTLLASRNATRSDFERVVAAIRSGAVPAGRLKTHECTLDEAPGRLPEWSRAREGLIKAMVAL